MKLGVKMIFVKRLNKVNQVKIYPTLLYIYLYNFYKNLSALYFMTISSMVLNKINIIIIFIMYLLFLLKLFLITN